MCVRLVEGCLVIFGTEDFEEFIVLLIFKVWED